MTYKDIVIQKCYKTDTEMQVYSSAYFSARIYPAKYDDVSTEIFSHLQSSILYYV